MIKQRLTRSSIWNAGSNRKVRTSLCVTHSHATFKSEDHLPRVNLCSLPTLHTIHAIYVSICEFKLFFLFFYFWVVVEISGFSNGVAIFFSLFCFPLKKFRNSTYADDALIFYFFYFIYFRRSKLFLEIHINFC